MPDECLTFYIFVEFVEFRLKQRLWFTRTNDFKKKKKKVLYGIFLYHSLQNSAYV